MRRIARAARVLPKSLARHPEAALHGLLAQISARTAAPRRTRPPTVSVRRARVIACRSGRGSSPRKGNGCRPWP